MAKKLFDFFGAFTLLVVVAPFLPLIALWIKVTSPGPVIFKQVRLGHRRKPFVIYKFRTMMDGSGHVLDSVLAGDSRVTVPGRFLRKTHMDELPQLANILLGHMSLVGPRPFTADDLKKYEAINTLYRRLEVRPGLAGLAQLKGREWGLSRNPRCTFRLDMFYVDHHNIRLDLYILIRTVAVVLRCKGI